MTFKPSSRGDHEGNFVSYVTLTGKAVVTATAFG